MKNTKMPIKLYIYSTIFLAAFISAVAIILPTVYRLFGMERILHMVAHVFAATTLGTSFAAIYSLKREAAEKDKPKEADEGTQKPQLPNMQNPAPREYKKLKPVEYAAVNLVVAVLILASAVAMKYSAEFEGVAFMLWLGWAVCAAALICTSLYALIIYIGAAKKIKAQGEYPEMP